MPYKNIQQYFRSKSYSSSPFLINYKSASTKLCPVEKCQEWTVTSKKVRQNISQGIVWFKKLHINANQIFPKLLEKMEFKMIAILQIPKLAHWKTALRKEEKRGKSGRERTVWPIPTSTGLLIVEKCIPPHFGGASPGEPIKARWRVPA